jgi:hypothetical protein
MHRVLAVSGFFQELVKPFQHIERVDNRLQREIADQLKTYRLAVHHHDGQTNSRFFLIQRPHPHRPPRDNPPCEIQARLAISKAAASVRKSFYHGHDAGGWLQQRLVLAQVIQQGMLVYFKHCLVLLRAPTAAYLFKRENPGSLEQDGFIAET